jgi:hypothetical protein
MMNMPKELTHLILAEQAYMGLKPESPLKEIIATHHDLYLAGAVLPDTLLHLIYGPHASTALSLSKHFHDSASNSYAPFIETEKRFPDGFPSSLLACLLGVLAHMQGDIVFHPYVYALTGVNNMGQHYRLETAIDVYFIRRDSIPPARHLRELVTSRTRDDLVTACSLIFDPNGELPRKILGHALNLHCRFQNMYDRLFLKLAARILCNLPGSLIMDKQHLFYPLNMSKDDEMITRQKWWQNPVTGERHDSSIDELAAQVVQRTTNLMERIDRLGSLAAALIDPPGENLLTGMYGVTKQEMTKENRFDVESGKTY